MPCAGACNDFAANIGSVKELVNVIPYNFSFGFESYAINSALVVHADCFEWMKLVPESSIHAVVTDPPYGVKEFESEQLNKRANGNGGVWRIFPSFDGCVRSPLPRFTALNITERVQMSHYSTE